MLNFDGPVFPLSYIDNDGTKIDIARLYHGRDRIWPPYEIADQGVQLDMQPSGLRDGDGLIRNPTQAIKFHEEDGTPKGFIGYGQVINYHKAYDEYTCLLNAGYKEYDDDGNITAQVFDFSALPILGATEVLSARIPPLETFDETPRQVMQGIHAGLLGVRELGVRRLSQAEADETNAGQRDLVMFLYLGGEENIVGRVWPGQIAAFATQYYLDEVTNVDYRIYSINGSTTLTSSIVASTDLLPNPPLAGSYGASVGGRNRFRGQMLEYASWYRRQRQNYPDLRNTSPYENQSWVSKVSNDIYRYFTSVFNSMSPRPEPGEDDSEEYPGQIIDPITLAYDIGEPITFANPYPLAFAGYAGGLGDLPYTTERYGIYTATEDILWQSTYTISSNVDTAAGTIYVIAYQHLVNGEWTNLTDTIWGTAVEFGPHSFTQSVSVELPAGSQFRVWISSTDGYFAGRPAEKTHELSHSTTVSARRPEPVIDPVVQLPENVTVNYLTDEYDWDSESGTATITALPANAVRISMPMDGEYAANFYANHNAYTPGDTITIYIQVKNVVGSFFITAGSRDGSFPAESVEYEISADGIYTLEFATNGSSSDAETLQFHTYSSVVPCTFDLVFAGAV